MPLLPSRRPRALDVLVAVMLALCTQGAQAQNPSPANPDPAEVLARVNGAEIRRADLEAARADLPPQFAQMPAEMLEPLLLDRLIDARLIIQAAEKAGAENSPQFTRRMAQARERVLQEVYLRQLIEAGADEDQLRQRFETMAAAGELPEEIQARHILVSSREEAEKLIGELQGGADFAQLADVHSKDPGSRGGDLGWFSAEQMVPPFSEAAFALETGEVTRQPVETQFGWHIIEKLDERTQPFEALRPQLEEAATRSAVEEELARLRAEATIEQTGRSP